jgi:elongation factor 1-gamma
VLSVAALSGVAVTVADSEEQGSGESSVQPPPPQLFRRNAISFTTPDGVLSDVNAVLVFLLAHSKRRPMSGAFQNALVCQWLSFASNEIDLPACAWLYPLTGVVKQENPAATAAAKKDVRRVLQVLNEHLVPPRLTLMGSSTTEDDVEVSVADVAVAFALLPLYQLVLDAQFRGKFEHVNAWFSRVMNTPEIRDQVGQVQLCEKMLTATK